MFLVELFAVFIFYALVSTNQNLANDDNDLTTYAIQPPPEPSRLNFLIYAYGTRGDIQPMIQLGHIIQNNNHNVIIAAHPDDQKWIEETHHFSFIPFYAEKSYLKYLMEIYTKTGISSIESQLNIRNVLRYIENTFEAAFLTTKDSRMRQVDAVIAPNWYFFGSHIAEYLRVPYLEAQFFPNTKTGSFDLYTSEESNKIFHKMFSRFSSTISRFTYTFSDGGISVLGLRCLNRLRESLRLRAINLWTWYKRMHGAPILYAFSPAIIDRPKEWSSHVHVVGYWLPENSGMPNWKPSDELLEFLKGDQPIAYVDLSSMTDYNNAQAKLISSLKKIPSSSTHFKWIIATGPSGSPLDIFLRDHWDLAKDKSKVYLKTSAIPHTWLLPKLNVYFHHGGAGTCAAAYVAGTPTVIIPLLGDQIQNCMFAARLGVGECVGANVKSVDLEKLAKRILNDKPMKEKVNALSEKLKAEDPAKTTMDAIYTELDFILSNDNQFPGQYLNKKKRRTKNTLQP